MLSALRAVAAALAAAAVGVGGASVAIDWGAETGAAVSYTFESWPDNDATPAIFGSADYAWNDTCADRTIPSTLLGKVKCENARDGPPVLSRHTLVALERVSGAGTAAEAVHDYLVAFGGYGGFGATPSEPADTAGDFDPLAEVFEFDVDLNMWYRVPVASGASGPQPRQLHVAFAASKYDGDGNVVCEQCRMIVHGGRDASNNLLEDVWEYDGAAGTWAQLLTTSTPLAGHSTVVHNHTAYIFGGYTDDTDASAVGNTTYALNLRDMTWSEVSTTGDILPATAGHTATLVAAAPTSPPAALSASAIHRQPGDTMVVHGGMTASGGSQIKFFALNLATSVWAEVDPAATYTLSTGDAYPTVDMPATRHGHLCVYVAHKMLCLGGTPDETPTVPPVFAYDHVLQRLERPTFGTDITAHISFARGAVTRLGQAYVLGGAGDYDGMGVYPDDVFWAVDYRPPVCPPGRFSPDGNYKCYPCPDGHASDPYDCTSCAAGSYKSDDGDACLECPPGTYVGTPFSDSLAACIECPAGKELPAGGGTSETECSDCQPGSYAPAPGTPSCLVCPGGSKGKAGVTGAATRAAACDWCPFGTASAEGIDTCTPCGAGTSSHGFVQRLQPYSLAVAGWGTTASGACSAECTQGCAIGEGMLGRCDACPRKICGTACDGDLAVHAGEVVYFKIHVYDVGARGTSATAPTRMLRIDNPAFGVSGVTVEKKSGAGTLRAPCYTTHADGTCATVADHVAVAATDHASTPSGHLCRAADDDLQAWHVAVRLDTAGLATLVFRAGGLMTASVTLNVTGTTFAVKTLPPLYTVATSAFAVGLHMAGADGSTDTAAPVEDVDLLAPQCVQVVGNVAQSSVLPNVQVKVFSEAPSNGEQLSIGNLTDGELSLLVAVSGGTFDDGLVAMGAGSVDARMIECDLEFRAQLSGATATVTVRVQQPSQMDIAHAAAIDSPSVFAGEAIEVNITMWDVDSLPVIGDERTKVTLSATGGVSGFDAVTGQTLAGEHAVVDGVLTRYVIGGAAGSFEITASASFAYGDRNGSIAVEDEVVAIALSSTATATQLAMELGEYNPALDLELPEKMSSEGVVRFAVRAEDATDGYLDSTSSDVKTRIAVENCSPLPTVAFVASGQIIDTRLNPPQQWIEVETDATVDIEFPVTCRTEVTHIEMQARASSGFWGCVWGDVEMSIGATTRTAKMYYDEWATLYMHGVAQAGDKVTVSVKNDNYFCDIDVDMYLHTKQDCVHITAGAAESQLECADVTLGKDESDSSCQFIPSCPAVVTKVEMRADLSSAICGFFTYVTLKAAVGGEEGDIMVNDGEWGTVDLNAAVSEGDAHAVTVTNDHFAPCDATVTTRVYVEETCGNAVTTRLTRGRAPVAVRVSGADASTCNWDLSHVLNDNDPADLRAASGPARTIANHVSASFDIVNPASLAVALDATDNGGGACTAMLDTYTATAEVKEGSGAVVTWGDGEELESMYVEFSIVFRNASGDIATPSNPPSHYITLHALRVSADGDVGYGAVVEGVATASLDVVRPLEGGWTFAVAAVGGRFNHIDGPRSSTGVFSALSALATAVEACNVTVVPQAVAIAVTSPALEWVGALLPETIRVEARDVHGGLVDLDGINFEVAITGCESGTKFPHFYVDRVPVAQGVFHTAGAFTSGTGTFVFYGERTVSHWNHDTSYQEARGAENCAWRVKATVPTGVITGETPAFEFVNLAAVCDDCAPGSWSPGAHGDDGNQWFTAGCTPCMIGTYSASAGAVSKDACLECPGGFGFKDRSLLDSSGRPMYEGLSVCLTCPAGSVSAGSSSAGPCTSVQSGEPNTVPNMGTIGEYCDTSLCSGCGTGSYQLTCGTRNSSTCTDDDAQGYCEWDSTTTVCTFVDPANEPVACLPCPLGTVQPTNNNIDGVASCLACAAGTFTLTPGHSERLKGHRDARACSQGATAELACVGDNAGQCPDGTYGPHDGMTGADDCVQCPAGQWSKRTPLQPSRVSDSVCSAGYADHPDTFPTPTGSCPVATGGCTACHIDGETCSTNAALPLAPALGPASCFLCPPGTYSAAAGASDRDQCFPCPAGHFCPLGTATPHPADRRTAMIHEALHASHKGMALSAEQSALLYDNPDARLGALDTKAFAFRGSHEANLCEVPSGAEDDVPLAGGWIGDSHFDFFLWRENGANYFGHEFDDPYMADSVAKGEVTGARISTSDHTRPTTVYYPSLCTHAGGAEGGYFATAGVYLCCPSSCQTANGGPGCGNEAAQCLPADTNPFRAQCCLDAVVADANVCGASHTGTAPCYIPGASASGSLELAQPHASVLDTVELHMKNVGEPLEFIMWGMTEITNPSAYVDHEFGVNLHFFASALAEQAGQVAHTRQLRFPNVAATVGTYTKLSVDDIVIDVGDAPTLHIVKIEYINYATSGGSAGGAVVRFDDVTLRPSPDVACNCSLGFFYNSTRVTMENPFDSACQRCPPNSYCNGGVVQHCTSGFAQGGSYACDSCPEGWLCNYDARGSTTPCPDGSYEDPDPSVSRCVACPLGHACRDGEIEVCPPGQFGDGGAHCHLCLPGYYTDYSGMSAQEGAVRCTKCPAGTTSNPMHTACPACPVHSFSVDGDECITCPQHHYTAGTGSTACLDCRSTASFPAQAMTVARNSKPIAITLIPLKCVPAADWKVLRHQHTSTQLGDVTWTSSSQCDTTAVMYEALPNVIGTDVVEFVFDIGEGADEQTVEVTIDIANRAPAVADDVVITPASTSSQTRDLETLLRNDEDPDHDVMFIHDAGFDSSDGRHGVLFQGIRADRRAITIQIPANFNGPIIGNLWYRVQDSDATTCTAPACQVSEKAYVTLMSQGNPPTGQDDSYTTNPSAINIFDVLANDIDNDNDIIEIVSVSKAQPDDGQENVPQVVRHCTQGVGGCTSSSSPPCLLSYPGLTDCICVYNAFSARCEPRPNNGASAVIRNDYIRYSALPKFCGTDNFTYTLKGAEPDLVTATVRVEVTKCVCTQGDVIFLAETPATVADWGRAKDFIASVLNRYDFSGNVKMGFIQYIDIDSDYQMEIERSLSDGSIATALESSAAFALTAGEADVLQALNEAKDQLESSGGGGRQAIVVLNLWRWPASLHDGVEEFRNNATTDGIDLVLVQASTDSWTEGMGHNLVDPSSGVGLLRRYTTLATLSADSDLALDVVDAICRD
eukprot:TRINITY_DN19645_c0_g1_i1.p1 TRINITY_DN19645_c0_g1~~TRINITY_DN19645_c0_g1_i1.p1  ORF type:complete len:3182 (+),score=843.55 TRINITY_DN19645_c0_g1_i1:90-9635(+)